MNFHEWMPSINYSTVNGDVRVRQKQKYRYIIIFIFCLIFFVINALESIYSNLILPTNKLVNFVFFVPNCCFLLS